MILKKPRLSKKLYEKLSDAISASPDIAISSSKLAGAEGVTTEYMNMLGLTRAQLVKLSRQGLVLRGYLPRHRRRKTMRAFGDPKDPKTPKALVHAGLEVRWVVIRAEVPLG